MSTAILDYMNSPDLAAPLPEPAAKSLAAELSRITGMRVYPRSLAAMQGSLFFLAAQDGKKFLGVISGDERVQAQFPGRSRPAGLAGKSLTLSDTSPATAAALRSVLPFLVAQPLGLKKSVGCGDRLGLATPGHVRAVRGSGVAPIFAQQSMRENASTGRTPQEVMDDAMWGAFEEGWREGFGADADHLKTTADIDVCAGAGYTFYTIDPGEYVDNGASSDPPDALRTKVDALPWDVLESLPAELQRSLSKRAVDLGSFSLPISEEELLRAAAKYGRAVAHTVTMQRHLKRAMGSRPFELEMSVDETDSVSTLAEHVYIAHELRRLGVRCVSLAPRYVGTFEKGADYIGDLGEFERSFGRHLAVAKTFGPYKLSLHSGSDKFSVYPIAARLAGELVHLKTAGTSYLEALRAVAALNPSLFREIVPFAIERYPADRASYHVSAEVSKMPSVESLPDSRLPALLDDFHAREVLHVTFGSVINHARFREPFFAALRGNEEAYYEILERHFRKHLAPFAQASAGARPS
ncbi:MAG: tagaturonate epimerase family protein [Terriglobia bacterium]